MIKEGFREKVEREFQKTERKTEVISGRKTLKYGGES